LAHARGKILAQAGGVGHAAGARHVAGLLQRRALQPGVGLQLAETVGLADFGQVAIGGGGGYAPLARRARGLARGKKQHGAERCALEKTLRHVWCPPFGLTAASAAAPWRLLAGKLVWRAISSRMCPQTRTTRARPNRRHSACNLAHVHKDASFCRRLGFPDALSCGEGGRTAKRMAEGKQ